MSWFGNMIGDFAAAIFPGSRAIVAKFVDHAVDAAIAIGRSIVDGWMESSAGRTPSTPATLVREQRTAAQDLAEEERYLAEKLKHDSYRSPVDADRIQEITAARNVLRKGIGEASAIQSSQTILGADGLIGVGATPDEYASQVGILSTMKCPDCAGIMTLQLGPNDVAKGQKFKWVCTSVKRLPCKQIYLKPSELAQQVSVRQPHADLDLTNEERRVFYEPSLVAKTAGRVRQHLGDDDKDILCPIHLLPMKLLPMATARGLLLDSYQYNCLAVDADGRACSHTIPVKSFGQVSGLLTRAEGQGIL